MGWCTTADLDKFVAAAGGYLRSTAVENTLLLSATQVARSRWDPRIVGRPPGAARSQGTGTATAGTAAAQGTATAQGIGTAQGMGTAPAAGTGLLFGWWEPPDGSEPRGAFLHDPALPLLIAGRAPEMAAALAGTLAKMGRPVCGVDGPIEAADAFAAAWSNRAGTSVRVHKHCRVYRLTVGGAATDGGAGANGVAGAGGTGGAPGAWVPPLSPGPVGRLRVATVDDRALMVDWLTAFATEAGERIGSAQEMADDLIGYGGAVLWESPQPASCPPEAARHPADSGRGDAQTDVAVPDAEPACQPVAMAALTRPVAGTVRISIVYTPPEGRRNGYAAAVTFAASRAVFEGVAPRTEPGGGPNPGAHAGIQIVMITDRNGPDRHAVRLGYQLVGERAVLRFGPPTGPLPGLRGTGPMPRLPTGPLPRIRR